LSAAILAANPHDTQPWLFHIDEKKMNLFANLARTWPALVRSEAKCIWGRVLPSKT